MCIRDRADTDTLDLVQDAFIRSQNVQETSIEKSDENIATDENLQKTKTANFNTKNYVGKYSEEKNNNDKLVISETINNNFYVMTINSVRSEQKNKGYIIVSEIGILPSNGTPRRSLSFSPPPVLNKSKLILKFPSLSIDISSPLI